MPAITNLRKVAYVVNSKLESGKTRKTVHDYMDYLVKLIKEITPYSSLSYVPSGSFVNVYSVLRRARLSKKKLGKDFVFPLCYGVANGYIMAVEHAGRLYASRSPLGDFLVEVIDSIEREEKRRVKAIVKKTLVYLLGGLLVPSRTSLLFILMKDANTDNRIELADHIRSKIFTHQFFHYRRLVLDSLYEIVDTSYLGMLRPEVSGVRGVRKGKYVYTPSNSAYTLARVVDELIDFETYKRVLLYVAGNKGFVREDAFKSVFGGIHVTGDEVEKLISEHPVLSMVSDFIERVKQQYEWLDSELLRLTEL
ncbi:MAG: hypothetical protein QXP29_05880 [Candidatus Nezhaarchaeales archaeon]